MSSDVRTFHGGAAASAGDQAGAGGAYASYGPAVAGQAGVGCCAPTSNLYTLANGQVSSLPAGSILSVGGAAGAGCSTRSSGGMGCNPIACMAGEECNGGSGNMAFVGSGNGEWMTETTYKYVGEGQGDVTFVARKTKSYCGCFMCVALLLALLAFLCWLLIVNITTTTTFDGTPVTTPSPVATCTFWGDPHLVTFDGARPSFYGDGEFWIVKNDKVSIQGRFMGTKYTFGLAATNKIAVAGPFLEGHVITIGTMESGEDGKIKVDDVPVCNTLGCHYDLVHDDKQLGTIDFNTEGELPDSAASQFKREIVHLDLPLGVSLTVFRWTNYMDLIIKMPQLEGGQDGACGNFNGQVEDDSVRAIFDRIGARVGAGELLFSHRVDVEFTMEEVDMLNTCPDAGLEDARSKCKMELEGTNPTTNQLHACMFDRCFGMNEHALRTARTFASAADLAAAGSMSPTA